MPEFKTVRIEMEKGAHRAVAVLTDYGNKWGAAVERDGLPTLRNNETSFDSRAEAFAEANAMWKAILP